MKFDLSPTDRKIAAVAAFVFVMLLLVLAFEDLIPFSDEESNSKNLGAISEFSNNAKIKNAHVFAFKNIRKNQKVKVGDTVFTGAKSSAWIQLNNGLSMSLGEYSMVVFEDLHGEFVLNVQEGNIRLSGPGTIKAKINGVVKTVDSHGTDVQIYSEKSKAISARNIQKENPLATKPERSVASVSYWRLYEVYENKNQKISAKENVAANNKYFIPNPTLDIRYDEIEPNSALQIQADYPVMGVVVEISKDSSFRKESTTTFWSGSPTVIVPTERVAGYYYRARAVNKDQEISDWSHPQTIALKPKPQPVIVQKPAPKKSQPPPKVVQAPVQKPAPVEEARQPATENTSVTKQTAENSARNDKYDHSQIRLDFMQTTFQSRAQLSSGQHSQISALKIGAKHWWQDNGLEGIFRSKLSNRNDQGSQASISEQIIRYHRRLPWRSIFSKRISSSLYVGYKRQQVKGSDVYLGSYQLWQLGGNVEMPLFSRWGLVLDLATGLGSQGANEYSTLSQLDYYLTDSWTVGLGYGIGLFDGGKQPPPNATTGKYRRTEENGFLNMTYHY